MCIFRLRSGIFDMHKMLTAGMKVGLGTGGLIVHVSLIILIFPCWSFICQMFLEDTIPLCLMHFVLLYMLQKLLGLEKKRHHIKLSVITRDFIWLPWEVLKVSRPIQSMRCDIILLILLVLNLEDKVGNFEVIIVIIAQRNIYIISLSGW